VAVDLTGDNLVTVWAREDGDPAEVGSSRLVRRGIFAEHDQSKNLLERDGESARWIGKLTECSTSPLGDKLTKRDNKPAVCYSTDQLETWFGAVPW
jgi:hypothetical protein